MVGCRSERMLYIVFLTGLCNLNCSYCGGTLDESIMPHDISYDLRKLVNFLKRDENAVVAFYGGEPLLRIDLMEEIIDELTDLNVSTKFVVQTNGILLKKVKKRYLKKFSTILVSIDGVKEVNDFYRGNVYDRVVENVKWLMDFYDGDLIARMVANEKTSIVRDVKHLLDLGFDHVHWQINAVWSPEGLWSDFKGWINEYNKGISELVEWWVNRVERGVVEGIVPFLGVLKAILFEPNTSPPCGAGKTAFAITTDGKITACPVCADFEWNLVGSLEEGIKKVVDIRSPCKECEYSTVCGGRCLFFNREWLWGEDGFRTVCKACKHLINEVKRRVPGIMRAVETGTVELRELYYPPFNNTTEIIP